MEKIFKLKENGTSIKTEIIAGLTTFMTMAYIIALNPNLLTGWRAGGDELWNAVFLATCLASGIGMVCMAFLANKPFCLAPGMGLNSFFALVVVQLATLTGASYVASFQAALVIILAEGILFLILTILNIREKLVDAIPHGIRIGIAPAIGLMLLNIGVGSNAGIIDADGNTFYVMRDFFGSLTAGSAATTMGAVYPKMVLTVATMFIGLFVIVFFVHKKFKGAVILGMLTASVFYWAGEAIFLHTDPFASLGNASWMPAFGDMVDLTLFKFNFQGFIELGWFTAITLIVTFVLIDMFDTIGTLIGTASRANMLDKNGKMPQMKQAMLADSVGTLAGSMMGTSTVTTFVESASGVEAGGRTGLTALTCAVMFFLCIFIGPIAAIIPPAATSAALIYVGVVMLSGLKNVKFDKLDEIVPVALMLIAMPVSGSIGHAIGLGIISFSFINILRGEASKQYLLTYILALVFILKFFLVG